MSNYTYEQIKEIIFEWGHNNAIKYMKGQDMMEVTKNNREALIMDFTFNFCLAQLVVSNPGFAPYQYVSFEAMTLDSPKAQEDGEPEWVCFFYDTPKTLSEEVISELTRCVQYCSDYTPEFNTK